MSLNWREALCQLGFLGGSAGKESPCNAGDLGSIPGLGTPTPVFWPGEFHGQRSLAGFSPWGCKESDTIEWLSLCAGYIRLEVKWVKVALSCPTLCDPMDYTVCGILQARILEWVAFPFSRQSSQPRDQTQISRVEGRFFTSWATGKPKNIGVGSLSLLQQIFPTQESNRGLLHCRWILYQLSYQGSP